VSGRTEQRGDDDRHWEDGPQTTQETTSMSPPRAELGRRGPR
jgi:hypothetical protein